MDEIQAQASQPQKSYSPPPITEADILKFIHQKAAEQRNNRKLECWEKLASSTKKQWAYANAYHRADDYARKRGALVQKKKQQRRRATRHPPMWKKKPPKQKKTCLTLMELARAFPNIAHQVFSSQTVDLPFVGGTCPTQQQTESGPLAIKGHPPSLDGHPRQHHEQD